MQGSAIRPGLRQDRNPHPPGRRRRPAWRSRARILSAAAISLLIALQGCGRVPPEAALVAAQPATDPVRPNTPYTQALRCIRDQLGIGARPPTTLTVGSVPDATGRITPGLRDMIMSAISDVTMGQARFDLTEIAVRYEGYGVPTGVRPEQGGALIGLGPVRQGSGYQLVGALTQADRNNQSISVSAGISQRAETTADTGATDDLSTVALDLRLVDISGGLSVLYSTRSLLAVRSTGISANAGLLIGSVGAAFGFSFNRQEGAHQAVRTLVELSVAELLGQAARVPYWTCLAVDASHPVVQQQIVRWWRGMSAEDIDLDIRDRLRLAGYPVAAPPASFADALLAYQVGNHLVPTGRPNFETYAQLVSTAFPANASTLPMPTAPPRASAASRAGRTPGIAILPVAATAPPPGRAERGPAMAARLAGS